MTAIIAVARSLDIGRVLSGAFGVVGRHFGVIVGAGLLYSLMSGVVSIVGIVAMAAAGGMMQAGQSKPGAGFMVALVLFQLALVLGQLAFTQALATSATIADACGRKLSFGAAVAAGFGNMLQVAAILVMRLFCEIIGYMLIVVPGVYLAVILSLAVPAQVAEKLDVFSAFGRSNDLVNGHRWSVFGLILVVRVINTVALVVAYVVFAAVLIVPMMALSVLTSGHSPAANLGGSAVFAVGAGLLITVVLTLFLAVNAAITAMSYLQLVPGDRASPAALDSIFN